ncbi:ribosomal subunit interface protein [Sporocytophaga myxococcoides]|uniref:Ribosomal subunit interface protein n=2 Tax=Sporocytophaga myxococcoides TaxID=153721 RepID=A0A098LKU3_9BACT|nr:ribosomal subunit interface protein [Sporocytophaga myxococcoides]
MQSIHFDADKKLLDFIQKKLDKLETFYDRITEGDVYLRIETDDVKGNKSVHVKLFLPGTSIMAKEQAASFEEAIDLVYENLKRQLQKTKEKMNSI